MKFVKWSKYVNGVTDWRAIYSSSNTATAYRKDEVCEEIKYINGVSAQTVPEERHALSASLIVLPPLPHTPFTNDTITAYCRDEVCQKIKYIITVKISLWLGGTCFVNLFNSATSPFPPPKLSSHHRLIQQLLMKFVKTSVISTASL